MEHEKCSTITTAYGGTCMNEMYGSVFAGD